MKEQSSGQVSRLRGQPVPEPKGEGMPGTSEAVSLGVAEGRV